MSNVTEYVRRLQALLGGIATEVSVTTHFIQRQRKITAQCSFPHAQSRFHCRLQTKFCKNSKTLTILLIVAIVQADN